MVQFHLPRNSKVQKGKTHNKLAGRKFNIYRFNPEKNENPKIDTFYLEENKSIQMVLDALIAIKDDIDPAKATPNQVCRAVNAIRTKILPDHKKEPNVGSFFKNLVLDEESFERLNTRLVNVPFYKDPENLSFKIPVAFLIEQAGWKGKKIGKIRVSDKHALVLIADEDAESKDLTNFATLIIDDIYNKHGITLEIEPNIF